MGGGPSPRGNGFESSHTSSHSFGISAGRRPVQYLTYRTSRMRGSLIGACPLSIHQHWWELSSTMRPTEGASSSNHAVTIEISASASASNWRLRSKARMLSNGAPLATWP
eukprot:scaffold186090_cov34-Tisochrysis_lutea.AAC.2